MNKTINQIALAVAVALTPCALSAATWVADYSVDADATYDDNFFMGEVEQDTIIYQLRPEASLSYVSPVTKSEFDVRVALKRYSEFDQFDSEDPAFDWKNSYRTERSTWGINLGYSENSQRDAAELDTGNFDSNSVVETVYVAPSLDFDLTERDQLGISLSYTERDYDTNDFSDNENESIGLNWQHRINEVLSSTATVSFSQYDADRMAISANKTDYLQTEVGFIYQHSKAMTINASLGHFETDSEAQLIFGPLVLVSETESSGTLLRLGIGYSYEKDLFRFNLSRGLYPSSLGVVEERDAIGLDYEHEFSGRSTSGINISWHNSDSLLDERESITLSPFYRYRLTEKLRLQTTYIFRSFDRESTAAEVESNRIRVGLRYSF